MKYTSKTNVEQYLGKTITEDIDIYINAVSRAMDRMADRTLVVDTTGDTKTMKYDGNGTMKLITDDFVALTSLTVDGTVIDAEDYLTEPVNKEHSNFIILKSRSFSRSRQNVVLVGHFGLFAYDGTDELVPLDLEHACTVLVAGIVQNTQNPEGIVRSESIGRYTVTYTDSKQAKDYDFAMDTINNLRRESF